MEKLFLMIALLFATTAHARDDGNWWNSSDDTAKIHYLIGYLSGSATAALILPAHFCMDQKLTGAALGKCVENAYKAAQAAIVSPIAGRQYKQFIAGVSTFYQDYRNLTICFNVALSVVIKEMNGMKQEEVTEWVQKVRAFPATNSCD